MKLKDLIAVSSETVNIRLYDNEHKAMYGILGYEESFSANFKLSGCDELERKYAKEQKRVLHKYGNWEVVDVWGFDNGLNIVVKGAE